MQSGEGDNPKFQPHFQRMQTADVGHRMPLVPAAAFPPSLCAGVHHHHRDFDMWVEHVEVLSTLVTACWGWRGGRR
jgi:hypothetical protein